VAGQSGSGGTGGVAGQSGTGGNGTGGAGGIGGRGGGAGASGTGGSGTGGASGTGGRGGGAGQGGAGGRGGAAGTGGTGGAAGMAGVGGAFGSTVQSCQTLGLGYPHEISLSADGTLLAVASSAGFVKIVRASDGADVRTLIVPGVPLLAVAIAPDGGSLIAGGQDGSLRRFTLPDGAPSWTIAAAHTAQVMSVRFAPGGATFASMASNGGGRLARASDGGMIATFSHYKTGGPLAFSPDGQYLASGGERYIGGDIIDSASQVVIWRATDATLVRTFNFSGLGGPPVAFSPDSQSLALAAGTVFKIVHVSDGTDAMAFTAYPNGPTRIAYTPDGATVVANGSGSVTTWSVASGARTGQIVFPNEMVEGLALTPDGARVVSAINSVSDQSLNVHRLSDLAVVWSQPGFESVDSLSYAPNGVLASGSDDTKAHLWNPDGTPLRVFSGGSAIPTLAAFLGDGSTFLVSSHGLFVVRTSDGQMLAQTAAAAGHMATSADGTLLATATYPKALAVYSLPSLAAGPTFDDAATQVAAVALSPDGSLFASGSTNGEVIVRTLGADAGAPLRFTAHTGGAYAIAFSPDGRTMATGGADGPIRLWQMPDGTAGRVLGNQTKAAYSVAFSPDGASLAAGFSDGLVRMWRVADGAAGAPLVAHTSSVYALAFTADGKRLASGGSDATIRVWCAP
jgi:WD40 repeat protein